MARSQLLKGMTSLLVLGVLRNEELYGYEIVQRIRERSRSFIEPGEGWLYPALHRLEASGALASRWRDSEVGPRRRYYRMTEKGRALLAVEEHEWDRFTRSVTLVTRETTVDA